MNKKTILYLLIALSLTTSCDTRKNKYDPYSFKPSTKNKTEKNSFEVGFKENSFNLKTIHVKLNNSNGYDAIFDTGCSDISISSLELAALIKRGTITADDRLDDAKYILADGTQITEPTYNIREISLIDTEGKSHTITNIRASIVMNPYAEILIGSSVIDKLTKRSYTVDLDKKVIRFQ